MTTQSPNNFDPHHKFGHVTRDGRKARIICTDRKASEPLVALVTTISGEETVLVFSSDGLPWMSNTDSSSQLLNAPAPRRKVKVDFMVAVTGDNAISHDPTTEWHGCIRVLGEIDDRAEITLRIP